MMNSLPLICDWGVIRGQLNLATPLNRVQDISLEETTATDKSNEASACELLVIFFSVFILDLQAFDR